MTDNAAATEIAALGRLCGIAPEYCDNSGGRHPTSLATMQALLSAMGVPWAETGPRREEMSRRRLGAWGRFLEPVQILAPGAPARITLHFFTPAADLPYPLRLDATIQADSGQVSDWKEEFSAPAAAVSHPVPDGFRHLLELRLPQKLPLGYYALQMRAEAGGRWEAGRTRLIVPPDQIYLPDCLAAGQRLWGFNLPLYAMKSADNWGIGDFGDLRRLTAGAASLGAAFVGVNPLHAPPPLPEADPSPYTPTSRLFYNLLYLDLTRVPEMAYSPEARALLANPEFQQDLARLREGPLVPYDQVFRWKRRVLGLLYQTFQERHGPPDAPVSPRGREFVAFLQAKGVSLQRFGEFCALAEHFGRRDFRFWPQEYHYPGGAAVAEFAAARLREVGTYQYGQWLAATQLQEVGETSSRCGLPFSLYQDLALGADAGGFDAWAYPGLFAQGAAIGAPPDAFTPRGQNWGIPPIIPQALRESGYQLFIDTLRANAPADGILRLDHVMGLFRLLWIPDGMAAGQGTYVYYPARELLAVLALESVRRRFLVIGEDLGTVSARVRRDLARLGVFSYRVFYFEQDKRGRFLPPEAYPDRAVAAVTTHDLPTLTGFCQGRDLAFKHAAELYPSYELAEIDADLRGRDLLSLTEALQGRGLLPKAAAAPAEPVASCPDRVREGVLEYLAQSRAGLLEVRLEEVFGFADQQNFPGTNREHPNWRRRLPLTLEEMARAPELQSLAECLNKYRRNEALGGKGKKGKGEKG